MHSNGHGVPKDDRLAVEWCGKAAAEGHAGSQLLGLDVHEWPLCFTGLETSGGWFRKAAD